MKIKDGYLLKEVAGNNVVIPVGNIDFNAMISLNETGLLLWKMLEKGADHQTLVEGILQEYDTTKEQAEKDVTLFVENLFQAGILENE